MSSSDPPLRWTAVCGFAGFILIPSLAKPCWRSLVTGMFGGGRWRPTSELTSFTPPGNFGSGWFPTLVALGTIGWSSASQIHFEKPRALRSRPLWSTTTIGEAPSSDKRGGSEGWFRRGVRRGGVSEVGLGGESGGVGRRSSGG